MTEHEASRTLVKSPPELWAECSEAESLSRHLGDSFGEIRITRLEPETAVAWEGEHASGTVRIEPSAWGTRVTLTAQQVGLAVPEPAPETPAEPAPETPAQPAPETPAPPDSEVPTDQAPEGSAPQEPTVPANQVPAAPSPAPAPPIHDAPAAARPNQPRWGGLLARMRASLRARYATEPSPLPEPQLAPLPEPQLAPVPEPPPAPEPEPPSAPEPEPTTPPPASEEPQADPANVLTAALDSLGQAHHRPFSRA